MEICTFLNLFIVILLTPVKAQAPESENVCISPSVITFLAVNSTEGTRLTYKDSYSNISGNVRFDGHFISSTFACGLEFKRCPNLTVISKGGIILVAVPLLEFIGVAAFERRDGVFTFRQMRVINFTSFDLECKISSISEYPFPDDSSRIIFLTDCLYQDGNEADMELDFIQVILNSTNIMMESFTLLTKRPNFPCTVHTLSSSVFFMPLNFISGVSVFASNTSIFYHRIFERYCIHFHDFVSCSAVQQLSSVPPNHLVLYCHNKTYLFNLVFIFPVFTRDTDGLPFFCSENIYYSYLSGNLSLHHNDNNRTQIGSAVSLRSGNVLDPNEDVRWGECIQGKCVVMYSDGGNVILYDVNSFNSVRIGNSVTTPRVFDESFVLLKDGARALVYNIRSGEIIEDIRQEFDLGYVLGTHEGDGNCVTSDGGTSNVDPTSDIKRTDEAQSTPMSSTTGSPGSPDTTPIVISLVVVVVVVIGSSFLISALVCVCNGKFKRRRRQRPNSIELPLQNSGDISIAVTTDKSIASSTDISKILQHGSKSLSSASTDQDSNGESRITQPEPLLSAHRDGSPKPTSPKGCYKGGLPTLESANTSGGVYGQESCPPVHEVESPNVQTFAHQESLDNHDKGVIVVAQHRTPNLGATRQDGASGEDGGSLPRRPPQMIADNVDMGVNAVARQEVNGAARNNQNQNHGNMDKL